MSPFAQKRQTGAARCDREDRPSRAIGIWNVADFIPCRFSAAKILDKPKKSFLTARQVQRMFV
jgi:hypothetical protein